MKENYKEILNKNSEVPEIVNLKCREAYTQILSDSKTIKHKKCFNKKCPKIHENTKMLISVAKKSVKFVEM